jgi:peptide/nickel transport system ATP-binding protein
VADDTLLEVENLVTAFDTEAGGCAPSTASASGCAGQTLGIVGRVRLRQERHRAVSILRLLPQPMGRIAHGRVLFAARTSCGAGGAHPEGAQPVRSA